MDFNHSSLVLNALGPALKNHLWQSTAFSVVAGLLAVIMRKNQARIRYWIWFTASIKFLIPFSALVGIGGLLVPQHEPAPSMVAVYELMDVVSQPFTSTPSPTSPENASIPTSHHRLSFEFPLAALIALVWAVGTLSVLTVWGIYWRRIRREVHNGILAVDGPELKALHEIERRRKSKRTVRLCLTNSNLGPGVYGVRNCILLWPSRISDCLDAAQTDAILAHELSHVQRRDNLTATIHMIVEAIFWFHPLVWWLGARLELERERACDEDVLEATQAPQIYAEGILKICEMCLESPLECVSGVTGSNLKERIRRIMTSRMGQRLSLSRKAILATAALSSAAVPIVFGQVAQSRLTQKTMMASKLSVDSAYASVYEARQTSDAQGKSEPSFEVATIKPVENGPKTPRFITIQGTNHFVVKDYNLKLLIAAAYDMNPKAISGGPGWVESDYYDIQALTPGQVRPSHDQQMAMLRKLLSERFKLTFHREQKEFSIYALEIGKDGSKLKATVSSPGDPSSVGPAMVYPQKVAMPAKNATMNDFTSLLQRAILDRPVVDMTGLTGRYDFTLEWAPDETQFGGELPAAPADAQSPPLFEAVQQQLGLKLDPRKGPVSAIVIDKADHPSPN